MRRSILACLVASASSLMGAMASARAQEPLLLRIRPLGETAHAFGGGSGSALDDEARQARARSEAVWARAERRSRIAIASVCTGCLAPVRPPVERPSPAAVAATGSVPATDAIAASEPVAAPSDPPPFLAQTGTP